jgi:hypothetical protein
MMKEKRRFFPSQFTPPQNTFRSKDAGYVCFCGHGDGVLLCTSRDCKNIIGVLYTEAGISNNNYCATNSGLPEVELRFCSNVELGGPT